MTTMENAREAFLADTPRSVATMKRLKDFAASEGAHEIAAMADELAKIYAERASLIQPGGQPHVP